MADIRLLKLSSFCCWKSLQDKELVLVCLIHSNEPQDRDQNPLIQVHQELLSQTHSYRSIRQNILHCWRSYCTGHKNSPQSTANTELHLKALWHHCMFPVGKIANHIQCLRGRKSLQDMTLDWNPWYKNILEYRADISHWALCLYMFLVHIELLLDCLWGNIDQQGTCYLWFHLLEMMLLHSQYRSTLLNSCLLEWSFPNLDSTDLGHTLCTEIHIGGLKYNVKCMHMDYKISIRVLIWTEESLQNNNSTLLFPNGTLLHTACYNHKLVVLLTVTK